MKTILIIDGAENCAYDLFQTDEAFFALLFPGEGQDVEFIEDFELRHLDQHFTAQFNALWASPVRKSEARGIDGILFFGLPEKKKYYPNKRDSDLDGNGRALRTRD